MKINRERALGAFRKYVDGYHTEEEKVRLKIEHTYRVAGLCEEIALSLGLPKEDVDLAWLVGLLHDIGRFEQLKQFGSFNDRLFNHADFGVKVLFEDGMIRQFIKDSQYDLVIQKAIKYHSLYSLDVVEGLTERERLHCQIIRDADKLDNFRVKDTERVETLFDTPKEAVEMEEISPVVLAAVRNKKSVVSEERVTHLDCWVSYLAFIFDLNFTASVRWILKRDYLNRNIDRINYKNPQAKKAMEELGVEPEVVPIRGGTDGARLSFMGLPCPNLCTGGGNFHGKNEYACIDEMETIVKLLVKLAEKQE